VDIPLTENVLHSQIENGVLRVQIDRPAQRNALSLTVLEGLGRAFNSAALDLTLRCAILSGNGHKSFAAGGDLKELDSMRSNEDANRVARVGGDALNAIRSFPVPVVAAVNGLALGGGAELALACDFRVAVPAARIGFVQGTLNISTAWGGASDLISVLGATRALELLISSRVLSAPEALEIGLFNRIAAEGLSLNDAVESFIRSWVAKPPHVVRALTAVSRSAKKKQQAASGQTECESFISTWTHADHWRAASDILVNSSKGSSRD
jgi:enoyl-CoA hydratase